MIATAFFTFSSPLIEHVLVIPVIVMVLFVSYCFMLRKDNRRLPPLNEEGIFETVKVFMNGKNVPQFYIEKMRELGSVYRLRMPEMVPWVVVCDPAFARAISMEEDEKPSTYKRFNGATKGIATIFSKRTHGDNWAELRKGLAPSFSMINICTTLPKMYEKIDELKRIFRQHERDGSTFEISDLTKTLTMDFLCAAMFGVDYCTMQSEHSPGRLLMHEFELTLQEHALKQVFNPFRFLMFWDTDLRRGALASDNIIASQTKILDNYRASMTPEEIAKDSSIIAHIVRGPYKSDIERCADMTVFMIAGHDTTSYTLSWIIIEVAKHPQVYEKLKAEIERVVPGDETVTQKHLNDLLYLDDVIREGMRLWPVGASGSLREASKDLHYKGMVIPKGSLLNLPLYCIFRNGIQDPDSFIPERWAADAPEIEKLKELYFPFSLGKRNCIGQNLASLETKLVLANLYKSFRFELTTEVETDYCLTLKPANAYCRVYSGK